ncbi:MAG: CHRD domain-containing protein [Candidatus Sericytochromatia bacterium]
MQPPLPVLSLVLTLLVVSACQPAPQLTPNVTSPGTSNQVVTIPQRASYFGAELTGAAQVPVVDTEGRGFASVALNPAQDTLTFRAVALGLSGPIQSARIHQGASGQSGEAVKDLQVEGNLITGTWKRDDAEQSLTPALLTALRAGQLYLNIQTEAQADGEIRGQLTLSEDSLYAVSLSGAQQVPPLENAAQGIAWVRLNANRAQLRIQGQVTALSGAATGVQLRVGAVGQEGAVLKTLPVTDTRFALTWSKTDPSSPLTDAVITQLEAGELYFNVFTAAQPEGEIRGQIR